MVKGKTPQSVTNGNGRKLVRLVGFLHKDSRGIVVDLHPDSRPGTCRLTKIAPKQGEAFFLWASPQRTAKIQGWRSSPELVAQEVNRRNAITAELDAAIAKAQA